MTQAHRSRVFILCNCLLVIVGWVTICLISQKEPIRISTPHSLTSTPHSQASLLSLPPPSLTPHTRTLAQSLSETYILPLGDSITQGSGVPGGYRGKLYTKLTDQLYSVTYLGTKKKNCFLPCNDDRQKYHEGHGGKLLDYFQQNVNTWIDSYDHDPDVILLALGTTEFADQAYDMEGAIYRWDDLIDTLTTRLPYAHILASNIIDRAERYNDNIHRYFNPFVEGVVAKYAEQGKRVSFVDLQSKVTMDMLEDNLHPNEEGYELMADIWSTAINQVIGATGDYLPPYLKSVQVLENKRSVVLTFTKPISDLSGNVDNFHIKGVTILKAVLDSGKRQITIDTSGFRSEKTYTLQLSNITDRSKRKRLFNEDTVTFTAPVALKMDIYPCEDHSGTFKNAVEVMTTCQDLTSKYALDRNCGTEKFPRSDLGKACPNTCKHYYDCNTQDLDGNSEDLKKDMDLIELDKCEDTTQTFKVNTQHGRQTCQYVQQNKKELCSWNHIRKKCPTTCEDDCSTTCQDIQKQIYIPSLNRKVGCNYLQKSDTTDTYCHWKKFKLHCPKTCHQCPKQINNNNEVKQDPEKQCRDVTNTFKLTGQGGRKTCQFIQKYKFKYCTWKVPKKKCPQTCGLCPNYFI